MTRAYLFAFGARGAQFEWRFLYSAIGANIDLVRAPTLPAAPTNRPAHAHTRTASLTSILLKNRLFGSLQVQCVVVASLLFLASRRDMSKQLRPAVFGVLIASRLDLVILQYAHAHVFLGIPLPRPDRARSTTAPRYSLLPAMPEEYALGFQVVYTAAVAAATFGLYNAASATVAPLKRA